MPAGLALAGEGLVAQYAATKLQLGSLSLASGLARVADTELLLAELNSAVLESLLVLAAPESPMLCSSCAGASHSHAYKSLDQRGS